MHKGSQPHLFELAMTQGQTLGTTQGSSSGGGWWDTIKSGATSLIKEIGEAESYLQKNGGLANMLAQEQQDLEPMGSATKRFEKTMATKGLTGMG